MEFFNEDRILFVAADEPGLTMTLSVGDPQYDKLFRVATLAIRLTAKPLDGGERWVELEPVFLVNNRDRAQNLTETLGVLRSVAWKVAHDGWEITRVNLHRDRRTNVSGYWFDKDGEKHYGVEPGPYPPPRLEFTIAKNAYTHKYRLFANDKFGYDITEYTLG